MSSESADRNDSTPEQAIDAGGVVETGPTDPEAVPWRAREDDLFRVAVEAAPTGMLVVDAGGRIVYANRHTLALFGYTADELNGRPVEMLVPPRYQGAHLADRRKFQADPAARPMGQGRDLYAARKDGSEFPVEIGLNPVKIGGVTHTLASVIDIAERKEHARILAELVGELGRSNQDLEQFASIAAHDLQEPLRKIRTFGEILKANARDELSDVNRDTLNRVIASAERMQRLVSDVLSYSLIMTQGGELVAVDLNRTLAEVLKDLEERIASCGAAVAADPLPTVLGDVTQLRQLLGNLIGNSIKFRREGASPRIRVSAREDAAAGVWELAVEDNGIGFEPQYADRIFGFFQRLHGRKTYEGTGLGLAICRKIVDRLGGTIRAEGEPGAGARFTIRLPMRRVGGR